MAQTRRTLMKQLGAASGIAVLGTAAYSTTQGVDDGDVAAVRVGHLSPNAGAADVYLNKHAGANPTLGDLEYPGFKPDPNDAYLAVPGGEYDVRLAGANTLGEAVTEVEDLQIDEGARYTLLAVGDAGGTDLAADGAEMDDEEEADDEEMDDEEEDDEATDDDADANDEDDAEDDDEDDEEASAFQQDEEETADEGEELQLLALTDADEGEDVEPSSSEAEVRIVNASPGSGPVNVHIEEDVDDEDADEEAEEEDEEETEEEDEEETEEEDEGSGGLADHLPGEQEAESVEYDALEFGEASEYESVQPGPVTISVVRDGEEEEMDDEEEEEMDDDAEDDEDADTSAVQEDDEDEETDEDDQADELLSVSTELYEGTRITAYLSGFADEAEVDDEMEEDEEAEEDDEIEEEEEAEDDDEDDEEEEDEEAEEDDEEDDAEADDDTEEDDTEDDDEEASAFEEHEEDEDDHGIGQEPMLVVSLDATNPNPDNVVTR